MGVDAGAIRAGQAFVEITADDAPMMKGLAESQARLKAWAAGAASSMKSAAVQVDADSTGMSGKWMQSIARGAGIGVAAHMAGEGMSGLAHVLKGEWQKLADDIAGIPLLGGAAISLANGFDDLFLGIRAGMKRIQEEALAGLKETQARLAAASRDAVLRSEIAMIGADPLNKQLMQINEKARQATEAVRKRDLENKEYASRNGPSATTVAALAMLSNISRPAAAMASRLLGASSNTEASSGGDLKRIEELRRKETAEAFAEQEKKAGIERLARIVNAQDLASHSAKAWEDTLFRLTQELAKARGATDALAAEEATAKRNLAKELSAGTITSEQYRARLLELGQTYDELALAAEGEKQDAARAAAKGEGEALRRSLQTPDERGRALVEQYKAMDIDSETRRRAIQKALEDAAGKAMPGPEILSRGQFGGQNAWMLGAMGESRESLGVLRGVEKNTAKIAELARAWDVEKYL